MQVRSHITQATFESAAPNILIVFSLRVAEVQLRGETGMELLVVPVVELQAGPEYKILPEEVQVRDKEEHSPQVVPVATLMFLALFGVLPEEMDNLGLEEHPIIMAIISLLVVSVVQAITAAVVVQVSTLQEQTELQVVVEVPLSRIRPIAVAFLTHRVIIMEMVTSQSNLHKI